MDEDHVTETLVKARELLSDPEKWAKEDFAYTADEAPVHPLDPAATCFCLLGALERVTRNRDGLAYLDARQAIRGMLPGEHDCVPEFNDDPDTTHADVLAVLDKAIAARRSA